MVVLFSLHKGFLSLYNTSFEMNRQTALTFVKNHSNNSDSEGSNEPVVHHVMPEQQRILDAFAQGDYLRLLDEIESVERDPAIMPKHSRILGRSDWQSHGLYLIAQLRHRDVRGALSNTFTQYPVADAHAAMRDPYAVRSGYDPISYINYPCDHNGNGVAIGDLQHFLFVLELRPVNHSTATVGSSHV